MVSHERRWTPPPNWPPTPEGWQPHEGWEPDPQWGPAPDGWDFWPELNRDASVGPTAVLPGPTSGHADLPRIESYPGFVTPKQARRSKWTGRPAVGAAAAIAGLILGSTANSGPVDDAKDEAQAKAQTKIAQIRSDAAEEVQDAESEVREDQQEAIQDAVDAAVAKTVKAERARAKKLVSAAKADAKAETKPQTLVASTDPRFDTCGAANAAGYGSYRRGVDEEYGWYQDRDNDGVVCE